MKFQTRLISYFGAAVLVLYSGLSEANDCGSKEGRVNDALTRFVIPQHFPPEGNSAALLSAASSTASSIL